ncbi:MAG: peptidoglycan bridge formation glycyltransferase FemA/FemB family protein [Anaerolineales bacterium]
MEVSLSAWNEFLEAYPHAHLLQTGTWGELKSAFGWEAVRLVGEGWGAQVLFRHLPLGFTLAYLPKGPVGGVQASMFSEQCIEELDALCRRKKAIFLKIEPDAWEPAGPPSATGAAGFLISRHAIQPRRTLIVDLRGSEADILGRMKQKCRYNIRLAEKKGVGVRAWDDLDSFHRMLLATGERDAFGVHAAAYYRRAYELFRPAGMAELLVAEYEGEPLAALMVFARGRRAWYLYGASSDRQRNRMPTYLLQWEAMRWARQRGAEEYDLYGVPDADEAALEAQFESRRDGLWGVYRFKRGFGGELRRAVPALDRVYHPLLYRLYLWRMAGREAG